MRHEDDYINDEDLIHNKTLHDYIDILLYLTSKLLKEARSSPFYDNVDKITEEMDYILIEMRHADWQREIG